jgi:tetratricopeptide repeat protein 30
LEAKITQQTAPDEAFRKFEEMGSKQIDTLRKLTKEVQETRKSHKDDIVKKTLQEYDETLER